MDSGSVVVVTADVRMGPLGWLSAEDPVLPGNLGLRDSMAALRWVGANAASFGGDAGRVTLVGHSAGAAEAEALLTTDRAKGLFHKVMGRRRKLLLMMSFLLLSLLLFLLLLLLLLLLLVVWFDVVAAVAAVAAVAVANDLAIFPSFPKGFFIHP